MVLCTERPWMPCLPQSPFNASMRMTLAPNSPIRAHPNGPFITVPRSNKMSPSSAVIGMGWLGLDSVCFLPTFESARASSVSRPRFGATPVTAPGVLSIMTNGPS